MNFIKKILIRILFTLLGETLEYKNVDDDQIRHWLTDQKTDMRVRHYFRKRDLQLLKTLGTGLDRQSYWFCLGRRYELLHLVDRIDKAGKKKKGR